MKQDELEGSFSLPLPNSVLSTLLRLLLLTLLLHVLQSFGVNSSTFLINSYFSPQLCFPYPSKLFLLAPFEAQQPSWPPHHSVISICVRKQTAFQLRVQFAYLYAKAFLRPLWFHVPQIQLTADLAGRPLFFLMPVEIFVSFRGLCRWSFWFFCRSPRDLYVTTRGVI